MFSHLSVTVDEKPSSYPISDIKLPFSDYIAKSRAMIEERRQDLSSHHANLIVDANCPFELYPKNPIYSGKQIKYGALLIHGLLDCPFSLRDVGERLQKNGVLSRAILLPGHGTIPSDLLHVSHHDWIQAVRYGVESLRHEVENIVLIGYSTGATLSLYHALQDTQISGVILLSPAIKIKTPVDVAVAWHKFTRYFTNNHKQWMCKENEIDYAKYHSITFNAITQVSALTTVIRELHEQHPLTLPIHMIVSREDETISSHRAIDFFTSLHNQDSRLLLYTSVDHRYPDPRIVTRLTHYPAFRIKHYAHVALPFSPNNPHYGEQGDYQYSAHPHTPEVLYGAYNRIESRLFDFLYGVGLTKYRRRELTYNPDFDYMATEIVKFVTGNGTNAEASS